MNLKNLVDSLELLVKIQGDIIGSAPTPEPMSAPTAEPVAYWFQKHNCFGQLVWDIAFSAPRDATQVVPLYATPPSAATPEPSDAERPHGPQSTQILGH